MPPDDSVTRDELPGGAFLKRMIFRVTIMFMALTSFCLFLRSWAKLRIGKRKLVVDDYSMLTAWFFYMLLSCLALNAALLEHHNPVLTLVVADKFLLVIIDARRGDVHALNHISQDIPHAVWFNPAYLNQSAHISFYDHSAPEIVLALTELGFGISAASLACLQPLFRHFVHKMRNWIQTWFSEDLDNTTGAMRSHMGVLPHYELQGRKVVGDVSKQPRAEACEAPSPELPRQATVLRHGITDASDGPSSTRVMFLSGHKSSRSVLPVISVAEVGGQQEQHRSVRQQRKTSLAIGVLPTLPTIATEIGTDEEEFGPHQVVADTPIQAAVNIDDDDRISQLVS
ncbi:hypothetical protein KCU81_g9702, partial [Aureobasidium melanogenum]|uniref:Uncharacterized protein n=1 Tax=Aureobasidium melanogenum (strain CBS 110374) TaxID=1043003 RepID=A0A074VGU2_AURM1